MARETGQKMQSMKMVSICVFAQLAIQHSWAIKDVSLVKFALHIPKEKRLKYMGSKNRIAKYILPIMLKDRKDGQYFVEPFCGGCNSLDKVANPRMGNDSNKYLIALLKEMQTQVPFSPPHIGEIEYKNIQQNKDNYPDWLVGYVGFNLSFAAKFFGGYGRDKAGIRNYENESQQNLLVGIEFSCLDYRSLCIPNGSIVYCDPPYKGTTQYKDKVDHNAFYDWLLNVAKFNTVFVSEYTMPDFAERVWEKEVSSNLCGYSVGKRETEILFRIKDA
jgi:DNA adenine methylase